jgi:predicted adenylyl cyclase CyaB
MARNVEIKARVESLEAILERAATLADEGPLEIQQDDTFFACANGRLKLRELSPDYGELIFYRREDKSGPKESFYVRAVTSDPTTLRECLTLAHGQVGRVLKHRTLFLAGRTRLHVDRVAELGAFLEIEVVLQHDESVESGIREANDLMNRLGIESTQLVEAAYIDLMSPPTALTS